MKDYIDQGVTKGAIKIIQLVPANLRDQAQAYAEEMVELTSKTGMKNSDDRDQAQIDKDTRAVELLNELKYEDNEALIWGFMLYNESGICKKYWTNRVGKLRKNKGPWFEKEPYIQWLSEIHIALSGKNPSFKDPLYGYSPDGTNKGKRVGFYDVMNSFRTYWNMYFLPILAEKMYKEDQKDSDYDKSTISIDQLDDKDDGAFRNRVEGEMSNATGAQIEDPEVFEDYLVVEEMLKAFTQAPLNQPMPFLAKTSAAYGTTYLQVMKVLMDSLSGDEKGITNFRTKLKLSQETQVKVMQKIQEVMEDYGVSIQLLGDYLSNFHPIAVKILKGQKASCSEFMK